MKKQTIIIILILLTLFTITNANPYKDNTPDNIWEERFQQVLARQEIQKAEFEKLKKNATEEVFYHEYGGVFERYAEVILENAGLFTISARAPKQLKVGEKAVISFRLGNMFNKGYFGINEILDENMELMYRGIIENGILSLIVPQGKIYVDYNSIELTYFQHAIDVVPQNLNTPKKILQRNNINAFDAETATDYFVQNYFKKVEYEELSQFEEATKEVIKNIYNEFYDEITDWAISKIPLISDYYAATKLGSKIFGPYIDLLAEYATENKVAIEKAKLDLMKLMAKNRNEYNIFDVPIVLNEKVVGTEDPIMAMIINIPIEVKEEFEPGDKMGFYFDGCLGEEQNLERSEYFEWDLNEWGSLGSTDDVEENMVLVEGGNFMMGDSWGDLDETSKPSHKVTLTYDYSIGKYEVTNNDFVSFLNNEEVELQEGKGYLGNIPVIEMYTGEYSKYSGIEYDNTLYGFKWKVKEDYENLPVVLITWYGAVEYCNWLSRLNNLDEAYIWDEQSKMYNLKYPESGGYRLPTEAEWEYAARGGKYSKDYRYSGGNLLDEVGWSSENSGDYELSVDSNWETIKANNCKPHEIGQKKANELGVYDMSGNLFEWCQDSFDAELYEKNISENPLNTSIQSNRIIRGGGWCYNSKDSCLAVRNSLPTYTTGVHIGFRVVKTEKIGIKSEKPSEMNEEEFVLVEGGDFFMGDASSIYKVTFTYDFLIGKYEVSNKEFIEFLNETGVDKKGKYLGKKRIELFYWPSEIGYQNSSFYLKKGELNTPVITVPWWGAISYCNWLSLKEGLNPAYDIGGNLLDKNGIITNDLTLVEGYRLPSEAEWEYAAKGGNKSLEYIYSGSNNLEEVGWYWSNSFDDNNPMLERRGTHRIAEKDSNELGLYDMSGNVWEWCQDWYINDYQDSTGINPLNTIETSKKVLRGGSWDNRIEKELRNDFRSSNNPYYGLGYNIGFRIVKSEPRNEENKEEHEFEPVYKSPEMILIKNGRFYMGKNGDDLTEPKHEVILTKDFYLGQHEVTNEEYLYFLQDKDSQLSYREGEAEGPKEYIYDKHCFFFPDSEDECGITYDWDNNKWMLKNKSYSQLPVVRVSWFGAVAYCNWLSRKEGFEEAYYWNIDDENTFFSSFRLKNYPYSKGYRLPTEAEWEYAAQGGAGSTRWSGTNDPDELYKFAWYEVNSRDVLHPVKQKQPNQYGLYDMTGNVREWCTDNFRVYNYGSALNPLGDNYINTRFRDRIIRGSDFYSSSETINSEINYRYTGNNDGTTDPFTGFRIARSK